MKLTQRGKRVRAIAIFVGLIAIYYIVTHLWWVGDGYCWGDMVKCYEYGK
jgi:hypothetical protein